MARVTRCGGGALAGRLGDRGIPQRARETAEARRGARRRGPVSAEWGGGTGGVAAHGWTGFRAEGGLQGEPGLPPSGQR